MILVIVSWAVVYTKRINKAAQKKETIDGNPEYGSEDSDQDGETDIVDKHDDYEMYRRNIICSNVAIVRQVKLCNTLNKLIVIRIE